MYILYDILLHLSLILLIPYFLFKMLFVGKYRKGILERFGFIGKEKIKNLTPNSELQAPNCTIWLHAVSVGEAKAAMPLRSEEHTSELQSQSNLVCGLLLEKKILGLRGAMEIHWVWRAARCASSIPCA